MFIRNAIDTDIQSIYEIAQQEGWKTFSIEKNPTIAYYISYYCNRSK
ncbi:hypothetical protein NIT62_05050 [Mammaliicoccus sciuri]|nr:hypothetical protein NIT62_05050 [Mammaliicoccus sciuri]